MEIDPKKMDFGRMKPSKNSNGEISANQAKNIDSVNNGAKYNPVPPAPAPNSNQPFASLKKPTELLAEAWQLYKTRWKTFLGIVFAPVLFIILALTILGIGIWMLGLANTFKSVSLGGNLGDSSISFVFLLLLLLVFISAMIIVQIWSQVALIYAIKDDKDIRIKESYRKGWRKIKQFFWVSILVGFITMGGFIFFAVPGFIFSVWFAFATFIVITEDLKGMDAILKSREYVRNYWWAVFWRFLFLCIVVFGFTILVTVATLLLPFLADLVSIALTPLIIIYSFLIYNDLKKVKGDFEFKPSAKAKKSFVAVGVLGILVIPLLFTLIALVSLNDARDKAMDTHNKSNTYEEDANSAEEIFEDTVKSRDKQRILDLNSIFKMLKRYKTENGIYPVSYISVKLNENDQIINKIRSANENADIPTDPKYPKYYYSYQSPDGNGFELSARLEDLDGSGCDFEIKRKSGICIYKLWY